MMQEKMKEKMNYKNGEECCNRCSHMIPSNLMGGSMDAKGDQCGKFEELELFDVEGEGHCDFYKKGPTVK